MSGRRCRSPTSAGQLGRTYPRVDLDSGPRVPPLLEFQFSSVQSLSHVRLCDPTDHSTPDLPERRQLPEFTQIHVHRVGDAIQPSQPRSSPSPTLTLSQHQGVSRCVSLSHQVAKVLEFSFSISPSKEQSGLISVRMGFELCLSCALGWAPRAPLRSRLASLPEPALCRARLPAGSPVFEFFPRGTRYFWTRRGAPS